MMMTRHARLLTCALFLYAATTARADLIEVVPFSLPVGPSQQTIQLPQFNPALGTLTAATLTVSGTIQYVLDVFNTGSGTFSATVHDNLLFAATPLMTGGTFTGTIPSNQIVFTYSPAVLPVGPLTETVGPSLVGIFVGTGTVPFNLSLPGVTVDQAGGATVLNVLAFSAASGNVTADYMFTPATTTVPEPGTFGGLAIPLLILSRAGRKRPVGNRAGNSRGAHRSGSISSTVRQPSTYGGTSPGSILESPWIRVLLNEPRATGDDKRFC